jgi:dynein heavy chain
MFVFAFIWSVGATTTAVGRERFSNWMRERITKENIEFPPDKQVYDWCYNEKTKEWISWFNTIEPYQVDTRVSYNEIVVPTLDSIRMKNVAKKLIMAGKHVLMPGPIGTGKSVYLAQLGFFEMPEEYQTLKMTFSA